MNTIIRILRYFNPFKAIYVQTAADIRAREIVDAVINLDTLLNDKSTYSCRVYIDADYELVLEKRRRKL